MPIGPQKEVCVWLGRVGIAFCICILHFAFCILHFALCTLHFALCVLHFCFPWFCLVADSHLAVLAVVVGLDDYF